MFSRGVAVLGIVLAALLSSSPLAQAGSGSDRSVGDQGVFCVMYLPTGAHLCVDDQAELSLARKSVLAGRASAPQTGTAAGSNTTFHIATIWDNAGYDQKRGSYEFYAGADCTASKTDVNWQNQNLASIGWSNRISSFQTFGRCQTRIFSGATFTGSVFPLVGYAAVSSNVGSAMNDNAESIRWS